MEPGMIGSTGAASVPHCEMRLQHDLDRRDVGAACQPSSGDIKQAARHPHSFRCGRGQPSAKPRRGGTTFYILFTAVTSPIHPPLPASAACKIVRPSTRRYPCT